MTKTEIKVVIGVIASMLGRLGSGNNWACGYRNGSLAEETILNSLRWQLERADRVDTILPILSLAGGTGMSEIHIELIR